MIYPATFEQKIGFDRLREQVAARCTMRAARERPKAPILSLTPNLRTARGLTVAWGVYSVVNEQLAHVDEICSTALDIALAQRMARRGDTVVVTAGVPFGRPGSTNMLRIETVAPPLGGL